MKKAYTKRFSHVLKKQREYGLCKLYPPWFLPGGVGARAVCSGLSGAALLSSQPQLAQTHAPLCRVSK